MPNSISNTLIKRKILVTGANGQVGKSIHKLAANHPEAQFFFQGREDMPLENFEMIRTVFRTIMPDVLINCAAFTNVDLAESEQTLAFQVNGEAVGIMAALCHETGARFIHVSTDYVFPGNSGTPYREDDPTGPINAYGASKLEGEQQALRFHPESIIVRTSWVYAPYGRNFVRTMLRLMAEKPEINVVEDQLGCPTYAPDLANALMKIALAPRVPGGIYHFSNAHPTSWYAFAQAIARYTGSSCRVQPIQTSQFPTPATRPAYSVLNCDKLRSTLGINPRPWEQALEECLTVIGHGRS